MATNKLFGNHIQPACKYCEEAFPQTGGGVLCVRNGPVAPEHSCRKYRYDPIKRIPRRRQPQESYNSEDFEL